jgi:hypothetical protein
MKYTLYGIHMSASEIAASFCPLLQLPNHFTDFIIFGINILLYENLNSVFEISYSISNNLAVMRICDLASTVGPLHFGVFMQFTLHMYEKYKFV